MSKAAIIIDIIQASTGNEPTISKTKHAYEQPYVASDFADDDLINKRAALEIGGGGGGGGGGITIPIPVIPAGEPIPFFIDAALYTGTNANFDVITKATYYDPVTGVPTGQLTKYTDMPVVDQDTNDDGTGTFTGWLVYGHDDDSGNFKEDTYVILRG